MNVHANVMVKDEEFLLTELLPIWQNYKIDKFIFKKGIFKDIDFIASNIEESQKKLNSIVKNFNNTLCEGKPFFKLEHNERDGHFISITLARSKKISILEKKKNISKHNTKNCWK